MKHTLILIALTLGLTASLSAQTASNSPTVHPPGNNAEQVRQKALIAGAVKQHRGIAFITTYTPIGSHIPRVVMYYKGHYYAANDFSVGNVYSGRAIEESGALDVGSALAALDPAITTR